MRFRPRFTLEKGGTGRARQRKHMMKAIGMVVVFVPFLSLQNAEALAEDASPPEATATRPAREHPNETSLPNNAPPANRTQTTGSSDQSPVVKEMNSEEKKKLETEGK
jgi:hypothetical protein